MVDTRTGCLALERKVIGRAAGRASFAISGDRWPNSTAAWSAWNNDLCKAKSSSCWGVKTR
jgi:hypothetical protein